MLFELVCLIAVVVFILLTPRFLGTVVSTLFILPHMMGAFRKRRQKVCGDITETTVTDINSVKINSITIYRLTMYSPTLTYTLTRTYTDSKNTIVGKKEETIVVTVDKVRIVQYIGRWLISLSSSEKIEDSDEDSGNDENDNDDSTDTDLVKTAFGLSFHGFSVQFTTNLYSSSSVPVANQNDENDTDSAEPGETLPLLTKPDAILKNFTHALLLARFFSLSVNGATFSQTTRVIDADLNPEDGSGKFMSTTTNIASVDSVKVGMRHRISPRNEARLSITIGGVKMIARGDDGGVDDDDCVALSFENPFVTNIIISGIYPYPLLSLSTSSELNVVFKTSLKSLRKHALNDSIITTAKNVHKIFSNYRPPLPRQQTDDFKEMRSLKEISLSGRVSGTILPEMSEPDYDFKNGANDLVERHNHADSSLVFDTGKFSIRGGMNIPTSISTTSSTSDTPVVSPSSSNKSHPRYTVEVCFSSPYLKTGETTFWKSSDVVFSSTKILAENAHTHHTRHRRNKSFILSPTHRITSTETRIDFASDGLELTLKPCTVRWFGRLSTMKRSRGYDYEPQKFPEPPPMRPKKPTSPPPPPYQTNLSITSSHFTLYLHDDVGHHLGTYPPDAPRYIVYKMDFVSPSMTLSSVDSPPSSNAGSTNGNKTLSISMIESSMEISFPNVILPVVDVSSSDKNNPNSTHTKNAEIVSIRALGLGTRISGVLPKSGPIDPITVAADTFLVSFGSAHNSNSQPLRTDFVSSSHFNCVVHPAQRDEHKNTKHIQVTSEGAATMKLCGKLYWCVMLSIELQSTTDKHTRLILNGGFPRTPSEKAPIFVKMSSSVITNVHVKFSEEQQMNVKMRGLNADVALLVGQSKPNVQLTAGHTVMDVNDHMPAFMTFDEIKFHDVFRLATASELNQYHTSALQHYNFDDGNENNRMNDLLTNTAHDPLVELFTIHINNLNMTVAPTLHLGRFIDAANEFTTALFQGLRECKVSKTSKIGYQLMEIDVAIDTFNFIGLEGPINDSNNLVDRLRFSMEDFTLKIDRFTPPSLTKTHLNELDEDPNENLYGLNKGGELRLNARNLVISIHPLSREIPLFALQNCQLNGFLYLTTLHQSSPSLPAPTHKQHPISSFFPSTRPRSNGVTLKFLGIPTKVYIDLNLKSSLLEVNYGAVMIPHMLLLDKVIERMTPPPSDVQAAKLQPRIGWWDNIRYWIHGKINIQTNIFIFRHLLDRVENSSWCAMIRSESTRMLYSTSEFSVDVGDLVLSLPRISYPFMEMGRRNRTRDRSSTSTSPRFDVFHDPKNQIDNDGDTHLNTGDRHSLILIPTANLTVKLAWSLADDSSVDTPYKHHCIYNVPPSDKMLSLHDRYYNFRSQSLALEMDLTVAGDSTFSPWIALRIDVLPWFEHNFFQDSDVGAMESEDAHPKATAEVNTTPHPKLEINSLKVSAVCKDLRAATWYGTHDTDGLSLTLPLVTVLSLSHAGMKRDKTTGLISTSTQVDIGETKAALLDIVHCYEFDVLDEDEYTEKIKQDGRAMFSLLQQWYRNISEFDYLVEANSVVILDNPFSSETTIEEFLAYWSGAGDSDEVGSCDLDDEDDDDGGGGGVNRFDSPVFDESISPATDGSTEVPVSFQPKPIFGNFRQNHVMLRPPDKCLPIYQQSNRRTSLLNLGKNLPMNALKKLHHHNSMASLSPSPKAAPSPKAVATTVISTESPLQPIHHEGRGSSDGGNGERDDYDKFGRKKLNSGNENNFDQVTWTVLVAGMRLLWTLEIRDAVMLIVGDLLHTLDMMRIQKKMDQRTHRALSVTANAAATAEEQHNLVDRDNEMDDGNGERFGGNDDGSDDGSAGSASLDDLKEFENDIIPLDDESSSALLPQDTSAPVPSPEILEIMKHSSIKSEEDINNLPQLRAGMYFKSEEELEDEMPESNLLYLLERKESVVSSNYSAANRRSTAATMDAGIQSSNFKSLSIDTSLNPSADKNNIRRTSASTSTVQSNLTTATQDKHRQSRHSHQRSKQEAVTVAQKYAEKRRREKEAREKDEARRKQLLESYYVNFQIHLTNPQIQLHSEKTSGSVVIAMTKAYVEAKEFVNFIKDNSHQWAERGGFTDNQRAGVLKKSELNYLIDGVEAYAMPTDVDLSAGLQWLQLVPIDEKEKREKDKEKRNQVFRGGDMKPDEALQKEVDVIMGNVVEPQISSIESLLLDDDGAGREKRLASLASFVSATDDGEREGIEIELDYCDENDSSYGIKSRERLPTSPEKKIQRSKSVEMKEQLTTRHKMSMMTFATPDLLKKMWHEFSLTVQHIMYNEPLKLNNMVVAGEFSALIEEAAISDVCTVDSMRVDLPELNFSLDAEQFFTTVDVIRNVLLAPPRQKRNYEVEIKAGAFVGAGRGSSADVEVLRDSVRDGFLARNDSDSCGGSPRERARGDSNISGIKRRAESRRQSNPNSSIHSESPRPSSAGTVNTSSVPAPFFGEDENLGKANGNVEKSSIADSVKEMLKKTKLNTKRGRTEMKEFLNEILGELEEKWAEALQLQSIAWGVGRGSWKIKHINKLDDVEVVFTGLDGTIDFYDDGTTCTQFDLENIFLKSYKPGPESIVFDDPCSVVRNVISNRNPCQRCGVQFDPELNESTSCTFHRCKDGSDGKFVLRENADGGGGLNSWSCCGANWEGAPGCCSRPHIGKEHAVVARIDSLPKIHCGEQVISLYRHIEFTFYPGVQYTMNIQLTKAISELFMAYFMGEGVDKERGQVHGGGNEGELEHLRDTVGGVVDKAREKGEKVKESLREVQQEVAAKGKQISRSSLVISSGGIDLVSNSERSDEGAFKSARSVTSVTDGRVGFLFGLEDSEAKRPRSLKLGGHRRVNSDEVKSSTEIEKGGIGSRAAATAEAKKGEASDADGESHELVFVKHWRVGDLNARVSLSGFPIDTNAYGVKIPAFLKSRKVGNWNYLIAKLIQHTVREVLKSTAASGLSKVRDRLLGSRRTGRSEGLNANQRFIEGLGGVKRKGGRSLSPPRNTTLLRGFGGGLKNVDAKEEEEDDETVSEFIRRRNDLMGGGGTSEGAGEIAGHTTSTRKNQLLGYAGMEEKRDTGSLFGAQGEVEKKKKGKWKSLAKHFKISK